MAKQKIEVQKGPIVAHHESYKSKMYKEKMADEVKDMAARRSGCSLTLHTPKR